MRAVLRGGGGWVAVSTPQPVWTRRRLDPAVWAEPVMRRAVAAHNFATAYAILQHDHGGRSDAR